MNTREGNTVDILSQEMKKNIEDAKATVDEITRNLRDLIDVISQNTVINSSDGIKIEKRLSTEDLYAFAIRIPAECAFIQEHINALSLELSVRIVRTNNTVTGNVETFRDSKGDAKERLRRAEKMCEAVILKNEIDLHIIKALQGYIERADKVYEGAKKIIDSMNREWNFDRKS